MGIMTMLSVTMLIISDTKECVKKLKKRDWFANHYFEIFLLISFYSSVWIQE
jgi:hypothetical protein